MPHTINTTLTKTSVLVAMSGGVDSSVTAILMHEAGHRVLGINMRTHHWGDEVPVALKFRSCCSPDDARDARACAATHELPFYVLDVEKEFKSTVIENFIDEYLHGRTPNPCIHCNRHVKLGLLLDKAELYGCDYVATGHFAIVEHSDHYGRWILRRGRDANKDQTYYLFDLTQRQLARLLMPLGPHTKSEVREMARRFGLPVHDKPESQEICFVPENNYRKFLERTLPAGHAALLPGDIVDREGRVIGRHQGYAGYTIGQRRGLGISSEEPLYVVEIRPEKNQVVVGRKEDVMGRTLVAENCNWVALDGLREPWRCTAQIRYRHEAAECSVEPIDGGAIRVVFDEPQSAITPGQALVLYEGDVVLGGGWIKSPEK